jgi:hypothetical protein
MIDDAGKRAIALQMRDEYEATQYRLQLALKIAEAQKEKQQVGLIKRDLANIEIALAELESILDGGGA